MIRRALLVVAVLLAGTVFVLLPPHALSIAPAPPSAAVLRGAIHVHTTNSDGSGTPDDVAAAVAFLASDEAAYITGQVLAVNGGMYL